MKTIILYCKHAYFLSVYIIKSCRNSGVPRVTATFTFPEFVMKGFLNMYSIFLVLVFFAGCLCGLLNVFLENEFIQSENRNHPRKPIIRTLIFGMVFLSLGLFFNDYYKTIYIFTLFFFSYLIAMVDLKSLRIPNALVAVLLASGFIFLIAGINAVPFIQSLGGLIAGFLLMAVPYYLNVGIGGGDVKLLAACGFFVGYMSVLYIMILVGVFTLIYLLYKSFRKKTNIMLGLKEMVPMGPFIALSFMPLF